MTADDIAYARKIIVKLEEAYNAYYNTSEGMPYDINETLRSAKFCIKDSLYYISRKEAEIERLRPFGTQVEVSEKIEKEIKAEAIKDFAERLKEKASFRHPLKFVLNEEIENIVKEMIGEQG